MTEAELNAIRGSLSSASPFPWIQGKTKGHYTVDDQNKDIVAWVERRNDLAFIAKAPQWIHELLAEVERLRARLGE